MKQNKFQNWLNKLKKSGKSDEDILRILSGVAKYSGLSIYEAIILTLSEKEMEEIESIESESNAFKRIEEIFKDKNGMTIDEFVGQVQKYLMNF